MRIAAVTALLLLCCGCSATRAAPGDEDGSRTGPTSGAAAAPASVSSTDPLIGTWRRTTTCEERVQALDDAGLGRFAAEHAATEGWIPGVTSVDQLPDPAHPCQGAVSLVHQHFFTADSLFGSRDDHGNQVDDGTYQVTAPGTVVINRVTFHFHVIGDTLSLVPELPSCASNGCFEAQWAVAVSYNGLPWQRVG